MSGFSGHELPDWVLEQFDALTTLPNGPLQFLPVPLGGQIVGAQSCVPRDGAPPRWTASIRCSESPLEILDFYQEFLPLARYDLMGAGKTTRRRSWFARSSSDPERFLIVFRVSQFLARMDITSESDQSTSVEVELADCRHACVYDLADREQLRQRPDVKWIVEP
jgi:hypothetical protein